MRRRSKQRKPRVVIDASPLMPIKWFRGVARVTLDLIRAFQALDELPIEILLFGQRFRKDRLQGYNLNFPIKYLPLPRWRIFRQAREVLPLVEILSRYDLLHIPYNYSPVFCPKRTIVTLHDAMFAVCPDKRFHKESDRKLYFGLANRCAAVITCSESSKRDIVDFGQVSPDKIHVTPWGHSKVFAPADDLHLVRHQLKKLFGIPRAYFLAVACDVGRKNSPDVLSVYLELAKQGCDHDLVMVWRNLPASIRNIIDSHPYGQKVHILDFVADEALRLLYCGATALLFPSSYEGFGLPVLEAMACGTPVITCNVSSLPEVGGDCALYIEPGNTDALRQMMEGFLNGQYDTEELRRRGLTQAARFSWEKTAHLTLKVYMKILNQL